jgi:hypothetical protein
MDRLKKINFRNTEWIVVDGKHEAILAKDPHALLSIAGYLKYVQAKDEGEGVYFRGQRSIYGSLQPALFRNIKTQAARDGREVALKSALWAFESTEGIFQKFGAYSHEALLQHYGIATTWMDLVDNVWVALWFACNRAIISGKLKDHMHFERRIPAADEQFAFILLIAADIVGRNRKKPGYYFGPQTELIDLRMAAPSVFLRPHAQHGLLFRQKGLPTSGRPIDYSGQVRGIVAVELSRALSWLGDGEMVSVHSLFPPPYYDGGYDILLGTKATMPAGIGGILHVNP